MISVKEALQMVAYTATRLHSVCLHSNEIAGHVVSEDIKAPINFPPFNQSAMDGYVISEFESTEYVQKGILKAGQNTSSIYIEKGEAYRIFTGAMVPSNAIAVVRQEDALVTGNKVIFKTLPNELSNIRFEAESVTKGETILPKATVLTPAAIGLLVSLGVEKVSVFAKPSIAIVATGDELVSLGNTLEKGKIYESNTVMLANAIKNLGFMDLSFFYVKDAMSSTIEVLSTTVQNFDFIIISGGVSVGDYDFVAQALLKIGVKQHFHKVLQKPGKPLFYGAYEGNKIFGLPGNPAAALTLFYIYVLPSICFSMGKDFKGLRKTYMKFDGNLSKAESRAQFLKAKAYENSGVVTLLEGQSSAMLQTFAIANALIYIAENATIAEGSYVEVYHLP